MSEQPQRDETTGRFLPGNSGFGGRPKGARSKLGEAFLQALHDDFAEHGIEAIKRVRVEKPDAYVRTIASLLPAQMHLDITTDDVSDHDLIERVRQLAAIAQPLLSLTGDGGVSSRADAATDYAGRA